MSFADQYLNKHKPFIPIIEEPPTGLLSFIVVIPVYLEKDILITLYNLKETIKPSRAIEVILVVNYSINDTDADKQFNQDTYCILEQWCGINSSEQMKFYPLIAADLPAKHAGAGLARKIGMDLALRRFNQINNPDGLILSLDADTLVKSNYFQTIENKMYTKSGVDFGGCILYFEHPIEGNEYTDEVYSAIIQYELHLRYYKYALKFAGFPFYHYTIGSCFGVRAGYYAQQGGMNRQKGGEDFYFLHKLFPHKPFVFINETCVYPSPRPSLRVPFGTGPTIAKFIDGKQTDFYTYAPQAFFDLKELMGRVSEFYGSSLEDLKHLIEQLPDPVKEFITAQGIVEKVLEINNNSATLTSFIKRFYGWFNGFMVVKYLNYSHIGFYKKIPVKEAIFGLLENVGNNTTIKENKELLILLKNHELGKIIIPQL